MLLILKCRFPQFILAYYLVFTYTILFSAGSAQPQSESSFHAKHMKKGDLKPFSEDSKEAQFLLQSSNKVKRSSPRSDGPKQESSFHAEYFHKRGPNQLTENSREAQILLQSSNGDIAGFANVQERTKRQFGKLVQVTGAPEDDDSIPAMCFKGIGCFTCRPPFFNILFRSLCTLPDDELNVNFLLYTVRNPKKKYELEFTKKSIIQSPFNASLATKVIIPGFNTTLTSQPTFYQIKDALLKAKPYNVIIVDWTADDNFPYQKAVANARAVGGLTALLLKKIHEHKGMSYGSVHMIGHSLGAHIAGWAGRRLNKTGRITGLDPAGVFFQHASAEVRLAKSDADFVDIIHSNAGKSFAEGFGLEQPIGDVDFYPNGGTHQPACGRSTIFNLISVRTCDHAMSLEYFRSSIKDCKYPAVLCGSYKEYVQNKCNHTNAVVDHMGFHAKKVKNNGTGHLKFYLATNASSPYCEAPPVRTYSNFLVQILVEIVQFPLSLVKWIASSLENIFHDLYAFIKTYF